VSILSSDVLRSGVRVVTGFWVVGRRSRQKEADVSSTVIFLLALKDHVETRDHLLASERASERVCALGGARGDSTLSPTPSVLPGKLPVASIHPGVALCALCARVYEIPAPRARFSRDASRTAARLHPELFAEFILVERFQSARSNKREA